MKESDLYLPVKHFLEAQGYEVKGEVHDCDVLAVRGGEAPLVVELKLSLNLDVILQAVERLALTSKVYVGVPRRAALLRTRRKQVLKLVKMLGLGLLTVEPDANGPIKVLVDPGAYRPQRSKLRRERLLGEFAKRVGDPNLGGSDKRRGIMTAYRQRALAVARFLERNGATKASVVAQELSQPKARDLLYRDAYGWFERAAVGVYQLSPRGRVEIDRWKDLGSDM